MRHRWRRPTMMLAMMAGLLTLARLAAEHVHPKRHEAKAAQQVDPCLTNQTTFVHIGPDDDTFALSRLDPCEREIVLVEPLTWYLNSARIEAFKEEHTRAGDFETRANQQAFDSLFECHQPGVQPDIACAPPLKAGDLQKFARRLWTRITATSSLGCGLVDKAAPFGLGGFCFLGQPLISHQTTPPRIELDFMAGGYARHLTLLAVPSMDVDWASALNGRDGTFRPVSTLVHTGVSSLNSQVAVDAVCGGVSSSGSGARPRAARSIRFIRQGEDRALRCTHQGKKLVAETTLVTAQCKAPCAPCLVPANSSKGLTMHNHHHHDLAGMCTCESFHGCREPMVVDEWSD